VRRTRSGTPARNRCGRSTSTSPLRTLKTETSCHPAVREHARLRLVSTSGGVVADETWPRVAVLGAGAVGCYFGGMLARAGAPVTLIGRPHHVEAIARDGLRLETLHFQETVPVAASAAVDAARDAAVVLFAVKTLDTETAARSLAPHLAPSAVVLSL